MLSLQLFQQTSYESIYIVLSAVVAVIIWFEGQMLRSTNGKMPCSTWFHVGSLVDTVWFFISLVCLYYLSFESITMCVPIAYVIYTLYGWFYGSSLMSENGVPKTPEQLVIPIPYIAYSQSFALTFFLLCALVLNFPYVNIDFPFIFSF